MVSANKGATLALKTGEGIAYGAAVGGIVSVIQNIAVAVFGTALPFWFPIVIGGAVFAGITLEGLENFFSQ
jgi:hypothetical protein